MKSFGEHGYMAWIDNPKNLRTVVQGTSPEETVKELLISLKVTISFLCGVDVDSIKEKEISSEEYIYELSTALQKTGQKELEFAIPSYK
jgi:hypothetical protein